jgi:hypothetical protein
LACPATGKANISRSALHTAALELHRNLASIFVDSVENDAFHWMLPSGSGWSGLSFVRGHGAVWALLLKA